MDPQPQSSTVRDFSRLASFLDHLVPDVYPEVPGEPHLTITRETIAHLHKVGMLTAGMRVLDIGCGQGLALEQFKALGVDAVGVTLGDEDLRVCRSKGFDVQPMDQNFMNFEDAGFDLLWCRHVLEHSIAPLFTLSEYHRLLKPAGLLYIEVPAPDTSAHHEQNRNHYSVLPKSAWTSLIGRSGFSLINAIDLRFDAQCGADLYWAFLSRRAE